MTRFLSFFNWKKPGFFEKPGFRSGRPRQARTFRPRLEVLEDRQLLSTFTVVLATDNGGPGGQMVTATTGDLRYCVEQADAKHHATSDSIGFSSALTASPTTITLSSANGPLVLSDGNPLTIDGVGMISVSGGGQVGVFNAVFKAGSGAQDYTGPVTINNLAIINGFAANGGGIYNGGTLTLTNCLLDHDSATGGSGGGIFSSYNLTLTNCTLSNDSASNGGGIYMRVESSLRLTGCTLNNNSATINGGGMYLVPNGLAGSGYTLTNCTIAGNSAGSNGGGIYHTTGVTKAKLINCTLSQNSAQSGGGIFIQNYGPTLINTIIAGNTATSSGPDVFGTVVTADHNLIGDASGSSGLTNGANGNIVGGNGNPVINPMLGPLQNNGGPTQTMALLPGSPAIAAADNSQAPSTDERGIIRLDVPGETTDIGAFEL